MRLLLLLEKFDNLHDTNDPLPSPQAFLNATLSEADPNLTPTRAEKASESQ